MTVFPRLCLTAVTWLLLISPLPAVEAIETPESVLKSYLHALYARDAESAYAHLASVDQAVKTLDDYRSENGSFTGPQLQLSRELANAIAFDEMIIDQSDDRASVRFSADLPDANAPALQSIVKGFHKDTLGKLDDQALTVRQQQIRDLADRGELPLLRGTDERWELVLEDGEWRVFENWAEAIEVIFDAVVMGELGWQFEPLRSRLWVQPGQTVEMAYRASNVGTGLSTGKARHVIGPEKDAEYLEIVACFCFLEQSLAEGESVELPLVLRVDFDVPDDVEAFSVRYDFFELQDFPEEPS